jgi:hypothetical protein
MGYWAGIVRRTAKETQTLQPWRLYVSIGTAVLTVFFNRAAVTAVESGLGVYLILSVGEFLLRLASMPSKIDHEQKQEIARLQDKSGQFRSVIDSLQIIGHSTTLSRLTVSAQLEIRSLAAPPTTMYDFTFYLLDGRNLISRDIGTRTKLESGELKKLRCNFEVSGISAEDAVRLRNASDWKATFKDVHDNEYETPVFRYVG